MTFEKDLEGYFVSQWAEKRGALEASRLNPGREGGSAWKNRR